MLTGAAHSAQGVAAGQLAAHDCRCLLAIDAAPDLEAEPDGQDAGVTVVEARLVDLDDSQ